MKMDYLIDAARSLAGAAFFGVVFFGVATVVVVLIRRATRRVAEHLTDVTALGFVSALAQVVTYLIGFVLYAHLIPELRALGTALLAGASVISIVVGLAAQNTLGNLVAGFSLVLYRPFRIGDTILLNSPIGVISARVELLSLGFTVLLDEKEHEVIVPNSVMVSSTLIRISRAPDRIAAG